MSKIIEVESCYYCPNSDSCELYQAQPNHPDIDCPLTDKDKWFKEELEMRFNILNLDEAYRINRIFSTSAFIDWLKQEL